MPLGNQVAAHCLGIGSETGTAETQRSFASHRYRWITLSIAAQVGNAGAVLSSIASNCVSRRVSLGFSL